MLRMKKGDGFGKRMPGSTYFHTEFLRTIIGAKRFHY